MNNVNTEELGRIVANAVSNFLSLPDQNNDNSTRFTATQTLITQLQVSIYINKDIFRYFHYLLDRPGLRCCHCQCARIHDSRHIWRTSWQCLSQTARGENKTCYQAYSQVNENKVKIAKLNEMISLLRRQPMILTWGWVVRVCVAVSLAELSLFWSGRLDLSPRSLQSCLTLLYSRYSSRIVHGEALITTVLPIGKTTENRTWNILSTRI